jgi:hypothetical protein
VHYFREREEETGEVRRGEGWRGRMTRRVEWRAI